MTIITEQDLEKFKAMVQPMIEKFDMNFGEIVIDVQNRHAHRFVPTYSYYADKPQKSQNQK